MELRFLQGHRVEVMGDGDGAFTEAIVLEGSRLFYDGGRVGPALPEHRVQYPHGGTRRIPVGEVTRLVDSAENPKDRATLAAILFPWLQKKNPFSPRVGSLVGHLGLFHDGRRGPRPALVWGETEKQGHLATGESRFLVNLLFADGTVGKGKEADLFEVGEASPSWPSLAPLVETAFFLGQAKLRLLAGAMLG